MSSVVESAFGMNTGPTGLFGLALEPVRNSTGAETIWFGSGRHVIGSSSECSHVLQAPGVQPQHCEIRFDAGHATLRALDFRTWLNGGPVRQAELHSGDRLIIGPLEFRISLQTTPPAVHANQTAALPPTASPLPVTPPIAPPPDVLAKILQRNTDAENRLTRLEAQLNERSNDLESRARTIAALEDDLAQRSANAREQETALTRRIATVNEQQHALDRMRIALEAQERRSE